MSHDLDAARLYRVPPPIRRCRDCGRELVLTPKVRTERQVWLCRWDGLIELVPGTERAAELPRRRRRPRL